MIFMTDQKAYRKLCFMPLISRFLDDFSLCWVPWVVWVRCLSSLKRWHTPRPLLLVKRRIRAESAHDSLLARFPTKFHVLYNPFEPPTSITFDAPTPPSKPLTRRRRLQTWGGVNWGHSDPIRRCVYGTLTRTNEP